MVRGRGLQMGYGEDGDGHTQGPTMPQEAGRYRISGWNWP